MSELKYPHCGIITETQTLKESKEKYKEVFYSDNLILKFLSNSSINKFTPVYDPDPQSIFGSVNAGSKELFVGGSGINQAFQKILRNAGQNTDIYQNYHKDLLSNNKRNKPNFIEDSLVIETFVFVHKFKNNFPYNNPKNKYMFYLVPPKGEDFPAKNNFLKAVQYVSKKIVDALNNNLTNDINILRICLFSGNIYKHKDATKKEVAKAILNGLL